MSRRHGGFTMVEMLLAVIVLSIGLAALIGSSGMVTRMIGRGQSSTVAAQVALQRLEQLRVAAASTTPPCTSSSFASSASAVATQGMAERWTVAPGPGTARAVAVTVTYRVPSGSRSDTMSTLISCAP